MTARCSLFAVLSLLAAVAATRGATVYDPTQRWQDPCPVLDAPHLSYWGVNLGYVLPADHDATAWDELGFVETELWGMLLYWENDSGSDIEMRLHWDTLTLQNFDGSSSSYSLTMARAFFQYSQRFGGGFGLRLDASPGLYAAIEELGSDGFFVPCGVTAVQNFGPGFACHAGASVYPDFDRSVDPRVGLLWKDEDTWRFELAYPETRLTLGSPDRFAFYAGARARLWPEFSMGDDPRERIRYEEARAFVGIQWRAGQTIGLSLQAGQTLARKLAFEANDEEIDVDDAPFVRFGLVGLFE